MRRVLGLLTAGVLLVLAGPGVAYAQDLSGQGPTDFRSVLTSPRSPAPGVTVRVIENGARLEIRNTGPVDVVVLGNLGEPFLRIGPSGVHENAQSPWTDITRNRWGSVTERQNLRPTGVPEWHKVSDGDVARWYDHRIHWSLERRLPLAVSADPDREHRVMSWTVPLVVGDVTHDVTGELRWVPGPSPWPGLGAVAAVFVIVTAGGLWLVLRRTRPGVPVGDVASGERASGERPSGDQASGGLPGAGGTAADGDVPGADLVPGGMPGGGESPRTARVLGGLAALVVASAFAHLALVAAARQGGFGAVAEAFFSGNLLQLVATLAGAFGAALLLRGRAGGAWLAVPALVALALRTAGYDLPVLWRSSSPFAGPMWLDRGLTVLVLGAGLGTAVVLVGWVRSRSRRAVASRPAPAAESPAPENPAPTTTHDPVTHDPVTHDPVTHSPATPTPATATATATHDLVTDDPHGSEAGPVAKTQRSVSPPPAHGPVTDDPRGGESGPAIETKRSVSPAITPAVLPNSGMTSGESDHATVGDAANATNANATNAKTAATTDTAATTTSATSTPSATSSPSPAGTPGPAGTPSPATTPRPTSTSTSTSTSTTIHSSTTPSTTPAPAADAEEPPMPPTPKKRRAKVPSPASRDSAAAATPAATPPPATPSPEKSAAGSSAPPDAGVSRRRFVTVAGAAGAAGLAVGAGAAAGGFALADDDDVSGAALTSLGSSAVPFHGARQAGITTPMQARLVLSAFDLEPGADRARVAALMRRWSEAAARMARGEPVDGDDQVARDAGPSSLTVTFGFGASLFDKVGLADRRPAALAPLPAFAGDALDAARGDGDLMVQVCADDALVAFHAARALQRLAKGTARPRWRMAGFTRSPGATAHPMTHRNLMGQVDGTNNPRPTDEGFDEKVFVGDSGDQQWLAGGSIVVVRRIRMLLDDWDALDTARQEQVIGRRKDTGAPLTGGGETTAPDYGARGPDGSVVIAADAHIRVSAPEFNRGAAMLRRGYSYDDGFSADGTPDAGLIFMAWQADPREAFVPVQTKLARGDALSRFIRHESSAVFAAPPGARPGQYVGQSLLEA